MPHSNELIDGEFFGTFAQNGRIDTFQVQIFSGLVESRTNGLPPLLKEESHELPEIGGLFVGDERGLFDSEVDKGGRNLWARGKGGWREVKEDLRIGVNLRPEGQESVVFRPGFGDKPEGHLLLKHQKEF